MSDSLSEEPRPSTPEEDQHEAFERRAARVRPTKPALTCLVVLAMLPVLFLVVGLTRTGVVYEHRESLAFEDGDIGLASPEAERYRIHDSLVLVEYFDRPDPVLRLWLVSPNADQRVYVERVRIRGQDWERTTEINRLLHLQESPTPDEHWRQASAKIQIPEDFDTSDKELHVRVVARDSDDQERVFEYTLVRRRWWGVVLTM